MTRRPTAVVDGEVPDGPTINGRPALRVENVQQWFMDTCGVAPSHDNAASIARDLNHCALHAALWKDTPEFKHMRRTNPSQMRMRRISDALAVLQNDVPALIDDTHKTFRNPQGKGLEALRTLLETVNFLAPGFKKFGRPGPGREPKRWHRIAQNLGPSIIAALKSCGVKRTGFGKPTSRAVKIMQSALAYLEVEASLDAIVDAMRARTKKAGKIAPRRSQTSRPH